MIRVQDQQESRSVTAALEKCVQIRAGGIRWTVRPSFAGPALAAVLDNPDALLAATSHYFKNSRNVTVARVTLAESDRSSLILPDAPVSSEAGRGKQGQKVPEGRVRSVNLVLRRLNYGRLRHRLRDTFRPTRAERSFRHGLRLEQAGVTTPRVVAVGARRILRWPVHAYLITEEVPGAIPLSRFLVQHRHWPRALVIRLADLIARLHARGFSHRDLKSTNVLLDADWEPYLIDLDGVRVFSAIPEWRARTDLIRFAHEFSAHPQTLQWSGARFLKRYCQTRRLEGSFRPWATQIMAALR